MTVMMIQGMHATTWFRFVFLLSRNLKVKAWKTLILSFSFVLVRLFHCFSCVAVSHLQGEWVATRLWPDSLVRAMNYNTRDPFHVWVATFSRSSPENPGPLTKQEYYSRKTGKAKSESLCPSNLADSRLVSNTTREKGDWHRWISMTAASGRSEMKSTEPRTQYNRSNWPACLHTSEMPGYTASDQQ